MIVRAKILLEFSQIIVRIMPVIVGLSLISWIHDWGKFPYEEFLWWFIGFYVIQFIVETQYTFMHIQQKVWQNPFLPELGNHFILKKSRKVFYFILKAMVYIEWYFAMLIPVFWLIKSIEPLLNVPEYITYIYFGVGMVITFSCSYIGRNVMKKRYFTNNKEIIAENHETTGEKLDFNFKHIIKRFWPGTIAFMKYACIFLVIFFLLLTQSQLVRDKTMYAVQYLTGMSDTHFRYKVLRCEVIDCYGMQDFQIEGDVLQSKVVNDVLYVYGITGYTKIHLTFKTEIEKAVNKRYDVNFLTTPEQRKIRWNRNSDIKKYYKDGFIIKEDFSDFTDEDIKYFVELTEKQKKYNEHYSISYDSIYVDPEDVRRGNTELTQLLYKEYERRFAPLK